MIERKRRFIPKNVKIVFVESSCNMHSLLKIQLKLSSNRLKVDSRICSSGIIYRVFESFLSRRFVYGNRFALKPAEIADWSTLSSSNAE